MEFRFELTLKCHNGSVTEVSIKSRAFDSVNLSIEFANTIWLENIIKLWVPFGQRKIFLHMYIHKHKGIWKQKPIFKILWNVQKPLRRESDTRPHPRRMLLISSQNTFVTNFATSCHIQVNILRTREKLSTKLTNISCKNTQSYYSYWTAGKITLIKDHLPPGSDPWKIHSLIHQSQVSVLFYPRASWACERHNASLDCRAWRGSSLNTNTWDANTMQWFLSPLFSSSS